MSVSMAERVASGIAWLDENQPDWRERVNFDEITFISQTRCPLGQLGLFGTGRDPELEPFGFNVSDDDIRASGGNAFDDLQTEWFRQLRDKVD